MVNKLTVIVLTHNDESRIIDCLECLNFANELIIIDDNSTDRTVELVQKYTNNVYVRPLNGNFANQRNFALNYIHNPWVLYIDSDELVSEKLKDEILHSISTSNNSGYSIKRTDFMWGKRILHGEAGGVALLRLAKINSGKWHGRVHETWRITGKTGLLIAPLIHVPHQSVREFVSEINEYSTLRAQELFDEGKNPSKLAIITYPLAKFIQNFIIKKGYKDGIHGFLYAVLMCFHSFLARAKLYQCNTNEKKA